MAELPQRVRFGCFEFDGECRELRRDGVRVRIQPRPFSLLAHLIRNRHRLVPREELVTVLWPDTVVSEDSLASTVLRARRAVDDVGTPNHVIETCFGLGFRFVADVEELGGTGESTGSAPPLAARERLRTELPFVGRSQEIGCLEAALEGALAGQPRAVLIAGEAGVGKTRLVQEFIRTAREGGAAARRVACWEGDTAPAFWPWISLLQSFADDRGPGVFSEVLGAESSEVEEIARLLPSLRRTRRAVESSVADLDADPEAARFRMLAAVARFLGRITRDQPHVLLLEDLHWADPASLLMLRFLLGAVREERLLVVGTYRVGGIDAEEDLEAVLAELTRRPGNEHLELGGLSVREVEHYVEQATGFAPPPPLAAALHQRTGGNPFFVTQLVRLAEQVAWGDDRCAVIEPPEGLVEGLRSVLDSMPPEVRRVVRHRWNGLSPGCQGVLALASVAGREFPMALLAQASGLSPQALLEALEEATQARIIERAPGGEPAHFFGHDLVRATIYAELPETRRVQLHRDVGLALEASCAGDPDRHVSALAHHFGEAALLLPGTKAADYAQRAGDLAWAALAYEEAAAHYERALHLLSLQPEPDLPRRAELLVRQGSALKSSGDYERYPVILRSAAVVAREAGCATQLGWAAVGLSEFDHVAQDRAVVGLLEEARAGLREPSFLQVRVLTCLAPRLAQERTRLAEELIEHAVVMARELGAPGPQAYALYSRATVNRTIRPECVQERLADLAEARQLARRAGESILAYASHIYHMQALLECGDGAAWEAERQAMEQATEEFASSYWRLAVPVQRAMKALFEGRCAEAEAEIQQLSPAGRAGRMGARVGLLAMGKIRFEQGRLAELIPALEALAKQLPVEVPTFATLHTLALLEAGRMEEARAAFDRIAGHGFPELVGTPSWPLTLALCGHACVELSDAERAPVLYGLLLRLRPLCVVGAGGAIFAGPVSLHLGRLATLLKDWDEAEVLLQEALTLCDRLRSPPWRARTLAACARLSLERGDVRRGQALAAEASAIADRLGSLSVRRALASLPDPLPQ